MNRCSGSGVTSLKTVAAHIAAVAVAVLLSVGAQAQNVLDRFTSAMKDHCVTFSYTYGEKSDVQVQAIGTVQVQGNAFIVKGNGLEIRCDTKTRWTADEKGKELVIENCGDGSSSPDNPALLAGSLGEHFRTVSSSSVVSDGKTLVKVILRPDVELLDISLLTVYFDEKGFTAQDGRVFPTIDKAVMKLKSGTEVTFAIHSMTFQGESPLSSFAFDLTRTDSSWIVTDLR